jgi:hypothetical protein
MNGEIWEVFSLHRAVRQGCPLAPYLFILAIDVLGYMLQDPKAEVEGLTLPKGGIPRDQTFADDIALYLKGTKDNMDKAKKVLDTLCFLSRAHINWHKSCAISIAKTGREWNWGQDVKLKWVAEGESTRYLRVQIGFRLATEANFVKLLDSLKKRFIS